MQLLQDYTCVKMILKHIVYVWPAIQRFDRNDLQKHAFILSLWNHALTNHLS